MKLAALLQPFTVQFMLVIACLGQTRPASIQDRFENLDFSKGSPAEMPPGWHLGPQGTSVYSATIAAGSCKGGTQCGNLRSIGLGPHNLSFLYQDVDATPYRGKWLAYRAAVRADLIGTSVARLLVRIHREDGSTSFRDDMGTHPITSGPWRFYEIEAPIIGDARDIEFGMQLVGEGSASIDNISFAFGGSRAQVSDDASVRDLIMKFADLRNAHDGPSVAALYSEDGKWLAVDGREVRGRQALTALWTEVTGRVDRSIDSVDFPGGNIAVIRATTQYPEPIGRHHECFIAIKQSGTWFIHVHQTVD